MVTYIYFVKCPNCEDEHFDFFDEAKEYAMGCLSQKPIITQAEVCRNDFGECTDHCDLGTVWSWEDLMGDLDKEDTKFSKAETFGISEGIDDFDDFDIGPQIDEFAELDNSVDFEIDADDPDFRFINEELLESRRISFNNKADQQEFFRLCKETGMITGADLDRFMTDHDADDSNLLAKLRDYKSELDSVEESCARKPIPEGMTIEQLKETMEENEDTVECTVCEELFSKAEGVKQGYGYICPSCQESTAEPFDLEYPEVAAEEEDDLDAGFSKTDVGRAVADLVVDEFEAVSGYESVAEVVQGSKVAADKQEEILATLDHIKEEEVEHIEELKELTTEDREEALNQDDEVLAEETEESIQCAGCEELFPKDECFHKEGIGWLCGNCEDQIVKCTWCEELYDKSECRYEVDLGWLCGHCEAAIKSRGETLTFREGSYWDFLDEDVKLTESAPETVELEYDAITAEVAVDFFDPYYNGNNWESGGSIDKEVTVPYTYSIDKEQVEEYILEALPDEYIAANFPGGLDAFNEADTDAQYKLVEDHFDELFDKYVAELKERYYDDAVEDLKNNWWEIKDQYIDDGFIEEY